jgi:hypothetical protein
MAKQGLNNASADAMVVVEVHFKKSFPKSLPSLTTILSPTQHHKSIISNSYLTAVPLIWLSNIIYSQALPVNVASQLFTHPKAKKAGKVPVKLWGMPLLMQSNGQHGI